MKVGDLIAVKLHEESLHRLGKEILSQIENIKYDKNKRLKE